MITLFTITFTILLLLQLNNTAAFSAGKGFGAPKNSNAFVSFDRFRSSCPADIAAIQQFEPSLIKEENSEDDVWVAVYRSSNNLPSVFVRDAFMDAMKVSTTAQGGDSETLVSSSSSSSVLSLETKGGDTMGDANNKPVAVARLGKDPNSGYYILDSMRCVLKKENTDADCDGGSEHAEAIGVCIDELVLSYLQRCLDNVDADDALAFDGGIHFRGTLVSGKLLNTRGFREVTELTADMHSHESDYDGALGKYAERSTSKEIAKNPGARDRALKIVSCLGRLDRDEDRRRAKDKKAKDDKSQGGGDDADGEDSDYDPWGSIKRYSGF